ncbi:MAG: HlyD family efflux transporter periplasmic adaptor subunit [Chloroflexi bacterium]|nr:HlyD family efflux transporter periplasmic adaptor subunit [Chloroflexota bacterium]
MRTVYVRTGQEVKAGEPLVDLTLDEATLRAAQTQATVAELAYQSQLARVDELRRGTSAASVEEARAAVTRARAALLEAELARDAARPDGGPSIEVQLAKLAVDQATDELANAQAAARRAQEQESSSSATSLRTAQRRVEEAQLRIQQLQAERERAAAGRAIEIQRAQNELAQAQEELARARQVAQRTADETAQAPDAAAAAVRAAERQVAVAALRLDAARAAEQRTTNARDGDRQLARAEVAEAQAQLAQAQANLRQRQAEQQTRPSANGVIRIDGALGEQRAVGTPGAAPTATPAPASPVGVADAIASVRSAERNLLEASQRLERLNQPVEADPAALAARNAERQIAQMDLEAAQENLVRAQATAQAASRQAEEEARNGFPTAAVTVRAAERRVEDAQLRLQQLEAAPAGPTDAEMRLAELALNQAQDDLAAAQAQAELAARRDSEAAQASASATAFAVRVAERKLAEATLRLQQARASEQRVEAGNASRQGVPDLQVAAARDALRAAEARLREMESAAYSAQVIQNEERRAALLQAEAVAARAAAQPVVTLTAPFDGTVTTIEVAPNQPVEARAPVVRLDDPGRVSVLANVSEWEVTRLAPEQVVQIEFPGMSSDPVLGTIVDVSAAAVRQGDRVVFPVRVDLNRIPPTVRLGMTATINLPVRDSQQAADGTRPLTSRRDRASGPLGAVVGGSGGGSATAATGGPAIEPVLLPRP